MTKQHFIALAAQIKCIADGDARYAAACAVAKVGLQFNSKFDRTRFLSACNVQY